MIPQCGLKLSSPSEVTEGTPKQEIQPLTKALATVSAVMFGMDMASGQHVSRYLTLCPPNFAMSRVMVKLLYISDFLGRSNEVLQSWGLPLSLALSQHSRTRDRKSLSSCGRSRPLKLPRERRLSTVRREGALCWRYP